jgi:hypothetical protein
MRIGTSIGAPLLLGAAALGLYLATAPPNIVAGDSPEFVVTISTLGICHPPGYPLYHLVGKALLLLLWFLPAARVSNFFSSLAAVATLITAYSLLATLGVRRWVALAGLAALAVSRIFWHFAIVTEVHMLNLLFFSLLAWLVATWHREAGPRRLYFLALLMGLSLTHHITILIYFPLYLGLLAAEVRRSARPAAGPAGDTDQPAGGRSSPGPCVAAKVIALFFAPLVLYAYLPLASARHPVVDWMRPDTLRSVIDHITAGQYRQLLLQYGWKGYIDGLRTAVAIFARDCHGFLGLAVLGAVALVRDRRPRMLVLFAGSIAICILVSSAYGIVDIEPYFLPGIFGIYILGVVGVDRALGWLKVSRAAGGAVAAGAAAALLCVNLIVNLPRCNLAHSWTAHDFGMAVYKNLVSEDGKPIVLFMRGDEISFTMLYLGEVEKQRPEVMLVADNYVLNPGLLTLNPANFEMYYGSRTNDLPGGYKLIPWGLVFRVVPENDGRVFEGLEAIRIRGITEGQIRYAPDDMASDLAGIYYSQQGWYYFTRDDRARALASFEMAAEVDGANSKTLYNLGLIYEEIGEWERALEAYSRVVAARDYTVLAKICRNRLAFANFMLSHYSPAHPEVRWTEYGLMLFKNATLSQEYGSVQGAIAALKQAISINPEYFEAYLVLGNIYAALKLYDEAYASLKQAAQLDPNDRVVQQRLEELRRAMGGSAK